MEWMEFAEKLAAAMAGGLLIGLEREWAHKSAGLRTNTLVATGSAIFVLISMGVTEVEQGDVTRIIGQVVTGVGFLGAGVILREQMRVKGLTTAATIWCSSAVGCLAGVGWYEATAVAVAGILVVNRGLRPLEALVKRLRAPKTCLPVEDEEEEL